MYLDIIGTISREVEMWEARKQAAISEFTLATNAIQALWSLTERMKEEAEYGRQGNTPGPEEKAHPPGD
jgi:hypothetical protein